MFMELLDSTVVNVSMPHIAGNLSATIEEATWVLTSYLVANAIVLPLAGWLVLLFGRKRFYMICVTIFTFASLMCGLSTSLGSLVFFRIMQGAGEAPCNSRPGNHRGKASEKKAGHGHVYFSMGWY